MFGLGITEIIIILAVAAVLFYLYWRNKKGKI
ncbi:MAG: twin-arginine translocase TatA/TatE family subunit [Patescibacteria group bacterium]